MEKEINKFVEKIKEVCKDRLSSVFVYGSFAVGDCIKDCANVNLMLIVDGLTPDDLKMSHKAVKEFAKKSKYLPVFMGKEEWFNSCDIYPIEYLDIKQRHKLVFGEDLISSLVIDNACLRTQCEKEAKDLLIKLRQNYIANPSDRKKLKSLILSATKQFIVIFRAILGLSNTLAPVKQADVVKVFGGKSNSEHNKFDTDLFLKILELRKNSKVFKAKDYENIVQSLIATADSLLGYVDKYSV